MTIHPLFDQLLVLHHLFITHFWFVANNFWNDDIELTTSNALGWKYMRKSSEQWSVLSPAARWGIHDTCVNPLFDITPR